MFNVQRKRMFKKNARTLLHVTGICCLRFKEFRITDRGLSLLPQSSQLLHLSNAHSILHTSLCCP